MAGQISVPISRGKDFTSVAEVEVEAAVTAVRTVELARLAPESKLVRYFGVKSNLIAGAAEVAVPVLPTDWKGANSDDPTWAALSRGVVSRERQKRASALRAASAAVVAGRVISELMAREQTGSSQCRDGSVCSPMLVFLPAASRFAVHCSSLRKWLFPGRASTERLGTVPRGHRWCKPSSRCQY